MRTGDWRGQKDISYKNVSNKSQIQVVMYVIVNAYKLVDSFNLIYISPFPLSIMNRYFILWPALLASVASYSSAKPINFRILLKVVLNKAKLHVIRVKPQAAIMNIQEILLFLFNRLLKETKRFQREIPGTKQ